VDDLNQRELKYLKVSDPNWSSLVDEFPIRLCKDMWDKRCANVFQLRSPVSQGYKFNGDIGNENGGGADSPFMLRPNIPIYVPENNAQ